MNIKKLKLQNGLKILLIPRKNTEAATVFILVKVGSEFEEKRISGISHFLEHMCFKGTKRRPNKLAIAKEFDALGAEYNAFTSKEYTGYFAKAAGSNTKKILDIVSDIYLNSTLPDEEIEKEKGVIIEEINMNRDVPQSHIWDIFFELLYKNQPAGWDIAGAAEIIKKLKRGDFVKFRQKFYHISNALVVVSGKFEEKAILEEIKKAFGELIKKPVISKQKTMFKIQKRPEIKIVFKKTDQTHLIFGFECLNLFNEKKYALEILSSILGGGMSSRLFQKIREEMGLAYYIDNGASLFSDHGLIMTAAGIRNDKIQEAIDAIWKEHQKMADELICKEEIETAKKRLKGRLVLNIETSDEIASFYGGQEILLNTILTPEEIFRKIDAVSVSDIKKIAQKIFKKEKLNIAIIGPIKKIRI